MENNKIIISGPPGSGKTTIIKELKKQFRCMDEINPSHAPIEKRTDKLSLSTFLFEKRIQQYEQNEKSLIFYDRSIIDIIAYMILWKENYPKEWAKKALKYRYANNIFYTPCWQNIYSTTPHRPEDYAETKKIDYYLRQTFIDFNYTIIELPKTDKKDRVNFILNNI